MLTLKDSASARHFQWPSASPGRHKVFCFSPHSLHVYGTRTCPGAAETRLGAPHFPHLVSIRVWPCLTVTVFRSSASLTRRSVSSRIACFDISEFPVFRALGATCRRRSAQGSFRVCNHYHDIAVCYVRSRVRTHHSEIMLGVLVIVLCCDRIAALGFGAGERQIPFIVSLRVLRVLRRGAGSTRYPPF